MPVNYLEVSPESLCYDHEELIPVLWHTPVMEHPDQLIGGQLDHLILHNQTPVVQPQQTREYLYTGATA